MLENSDIVNKLLSKDLLVPLIDALHNADVNPICQCLFNVYGKKYTNISEIKSDAIDFKNNLVNKVTQYLKKRQNNIYVRHRYFLKWRELIKIYDPDFLIALYINEKKLNKYKHDSFIKSDDPVLWNEFNNNASELHYHLNGGGNTFHTNWLGLHINSDLNKSFERAKIGDEKEEMRNISYLSIGLRLHLLRQVDNTFERRVDLSELLKWYKEGCAHIFLNSLARCSYAYLEMNNLEFDYAEILINNKNDVNTNSGERALLTKIVDKTFLDADNNFILLWLYLITKKILLDRFVVNEHGFKPFKEAFIYNHLFLNNRQIKRSIEYNTAEQLLEKPTIKQIEFRISPKLINSASRRMRKALELKNTNNIGLTPLKYGFVIHLLKTKKRRNPKRNYYADTKEILRKAGPISNIYRKICGLDAAAYELNHNPEEFGPAFRYAKSKVLHSGIAELSKNETYRVGRTFHVGEVFDDLVTGIRRVWEAIEYLDLGDGDRLGHCVSLGKSPSKFYKSKSFQIDTYELLDNLVFLYFNGGLIPKYYKYADNLIKNLFPDWYKNASNPVKSYWYSFAFRSDYIEDPSLNSDTSFHKLASSDKDALELYRYGKDKKSVSVTFKVTRSILNSIKASQEKMLSLIKNKGILIESNPSSNFYIGEFDSYRNLPFYKIYRSGNKVSINTDDPGCFNTCLFNEYSIIKEANSRVSKYKIDFGKVIRDSDEYCFIK